MKLFMIVIDEDCQTTNEKVAITIPASLTVRQRQVAELMAKGEMSPEIARKLDLALTTVKVYSSQVLRALGVENRTKAALKMHGLL